MSDEAEKASMQRLKAEWNPKVPFPEASMQQQHSPEVVTFF
jgi:hypothetical protein